MASIARRTVQRETPSAENQLRSGGQAFVQMLLDAGVTHMFGNPGTTELPILDTLLVDGRLRYILGLHEGPVVSMADGFSTACRKPCAVNLHVSCGLGNAMGMLYNAFRAGTPLLVTAGQQDRRLMFEEPILWSDMAAVARPFTKWSAEVQRVQDLPSALRRALQMAAAPPTGPVFLSIPMDLQAEVAQLDLTPAAPLDPHVRPPRESLLQAAELLRAAKNPVILVGSRSLELGAVQELVQVAEQLGAAVISESGTTHGRLGFPCDHALYCQGLPLWSYEVRDRLLEFDVALIVGMDVFRQYLYYEPRPIPEHLQLIHIDEDPWQLGKNYPLAVAVWGHAKPALAELHGLLKEKMSPSQCAAAKARCQQIAAQNWRAQQELRQQIDRERGIRPLTANTLMHALANALPPNAAVVEEAVTTTGTILERLGAIKDPSGYFGHRGWALGWGMGAAIGIKLAWPERPVLAILGEGSSMYGVQALWSAAHYRVPVVFVICNNSQYQILKMGARGMKLPGATAGRYLANDLTDPEIDFVQLATALGVQAVRIHDPDELTQRVAQGLQDSQPLLIDVPIQRGVPDRLNYG